MRWEISVKFLKNRCDQPYSSAMGTSQAIGPYRTVYTSTSQANSFSIFLDQKGNNFQDLVKDPEVPRTDPRDNTGNRYSVSTFNGHNKSILNAVFLDEMRVLTCAKVNYIR